MSCKKCRHWFVNPNIVIPGEPTEGKCLVSEIKTQSNQVCNAWELSQIAEWKDDNEKLTARIAELEAERRWIPVSEPPTVCRDKYGEFIPYLVCTHRGEYPFRAFWDGTMWGDGVRQVFVTHWMPLPLPPEVQE